jgi:hypothetical protein
MSIEELAFTSHRLSGIEADRRFQWNAAKAPIGWHVRTRNWLGATMQSRNRSAGTSRPTA